MATITTARAANILGVSVRRIQAMIHDGKIRASKFGRDWQIIEKSLDNVKNRKPGRPKTINGND